MPFNDTACISPHNHDCARERQSLTLCLSAELVRNNNEIYIGCICSQKNETKHKMYLPSSTRCANWKSLELTKTKKLNRTSSMTHRHWLTFLKISDYLCLTAAYHDCQLQTEWYFLACPDRVFDPTNLFGTDKNE